MLPLIESAAGFANLAGICAVTGVERCIFGTIDFMLDLDIPIDGQGLAYFRSMRALNSRLAGIAAPVDGATTDLASPAATIADTRRARAFGFSGKLCIHPNQVEWVHQAMSPEEHEIAWAKQVAAAAQSATHGALTVAGRMVDKPVIERARKVLELAERSFTRSSD